ncbi:MAG: response regulator [Hyphomonadaceae bacterium]|nr:response regulator [Hyphomonadaceae bacterium]GIK48776.1 MAG: response regulator [Alphaproteobacteria bacterium]
MSTPDPNAVFNLTKASVLVVEQSQHSLDVTSQMLKGFGAGEIVRGEALAEVEKRVESRPFELIVIDPSIEDGRGYHFLTALRRSAGPNAYTPVIIVSGHVRSADVARARDTGANYVVTKPISPAVLLQRILYVGRDRRQFVQTPTYVGPDRRFKFEGPPPGCEGRRSTDLKAPIGAAEEPNMSEAELEAFFKPQRVSL